jgi:hypothetical protein
MRLISKGTSKSFVRRTIDGVKAAGEKPERVEVAPDGRCIITLRNATTTADARPTENKNEWDE